MIRLGAVRRDELQPRLLSLADRPLGRLLLFAGVAFAARAVLRGVEIVDLDEAAYLTVARELLRGGRLYVDAADHKPPLVFLYYALGQLLPGSGMLPVRLLTDLVTVPLTALGASAFFRHGRRGLLAGLLLVVYGAAFLGHDALAVNCELLMALPLAWALVLIRDPAAAARPLRAAGAGLLVGLAVLFKYQAGPWLLPIAVAVLLGRRQACGGEGSGTRRAARGERGEVPGGAGWRRLVDARGAALAGAARALLAIAAAALPSLAAWAWFAVQGRAADFLYWNLGHNLGYVGHAPGFAEAAGRGLAYGSAFLLAMAPLSWLAFRGVRRAARAWPSEAAGRPLEAAGRSPEAAGRPPGPAYHSPATHRPIEPGTHRLALLLGCLAVAFATAFLGGRFYPHYFLPMQLPLALLAAPEAERLLVPPVGRAGRVFVTATALLWVGFTLSSAVLYARDDVYLETRPVFARVAARLRGEACAGPLFVWGFAPQFYTASGRAPASRFLMVGTTLVGHVSGHAGRDAAAVREEHWNWLMADLARRPPAFVLDTAGARLSRWDAPVAEFPRFAAFLRGYDAVDRIDGVVVYRRHECAGDGLLGTNK